MAWNDLPLGDAFQLLEPLSAPKPRGMVSSQPALGDAVDPLQMLAMASNEGKVVRLTFSLTWQWSLIKKNVPVSGMLICIPIRPSVWPGRWWRVIP